VNKESERKKKVVTRTALNWPVWPVEGLAVE
jgi:hypothetical protein